MTANKNRQRGKRTEREIAKLIPNSKRVGILGSEDIEHNILSIEVKSRQRFVADEWMRQAERNCPEGKVPIVIVHMYAKNHDKDLVVLKLKNFLPLLECYNAAENIKR